jgi:hypothetical protein
MTRMLPRWRDEWSDGCSFAPIASATACRACCVRHDEAYYYGGGKADRRRADEQFLVCLVGRGMPSALAEVYYRAVRIGGAPRLHIPRVSWAFGGQVFRYTERPAEAT